jgi:hypothetical protein
MKVSKVVIAFLPSLYYFFRENFKGHNMERESIRYVMHGVI